MQGGAASAMTGGRAYWQMCSLLGTQGVSRGKHSEHQEAGQDGLEAPRAGQAHALIQPVCRSQRRREAGRVNLQRQQHPNEPAGFHNSVNRAAHADAGEMLEGDGVTLTQLSLDWPLMDPCMRKKVELRP